MVIELVSLLGEYYLSVIQGKYLYRLNAFPLADPHLRTFNEAILQPLVPTDISAEKLWRTLIKNNWKDKCIAFVQKKKKKGITGPIILNSVPEKIWEQNSIYKLVTENKEMSKSQEASVNNKSS